MLNKLKSLNYQFGNDGTITQVTVGFNDYRTNVQGNLTVILRPEDGDLNSHTPKQLQELAKAKALEVLSSVEEVPALPEGEGVVEEQ